jgi:hypothetical protein
LLPRNTRGVDIVNTRANLIRVAILLEGLKKLHVALRCLNGDDISIEALDGGEDIAEIGVAEVRMCLELVRNAGGCKLERVDSPFEIAIPISPTKWQLDIGQYLDDH